MLSTGIAAPGCKPKPPQPVVVPDGPGPEPQDGPLATIRAELETKLMELNDGACNGRTYAQQDLLEPVKVAPHEGLIQTELVVRIRERCVPVWNPDKKDWEMQTLNLRTYGFPKDPNRPITPEDADDPKSPNIAWSAPGPTFVMHPASTPGAPDGTRFKMRLYNRMPHDGDPTTCQVNVKCNTKGPNAGIDPQTGQCKTPVDTLQGGSPPQTPSQQLPDGEVVEPPNCFHGLDSTNFHFHGFHVSPQLGQDFVGLELRPPLPPGVQPGDMPEHGSHGEHSVVRYGQFDFDVDPLRYTQPPGTHWYHAHKHGSTALHVLNGQVGTFEIRGEFDRQLEEFFETKGGGPLRDRLLVVQQLQERQPGLGGADQTQAVLVNGQANPILRMARNEIQRWRFVGATMQASAALRIGFPESDAQPQIRQIAMDGVQFSPDNYECQPFLKRPDCSPDPDKTPFDELTDFDLSPGNRVDLLVKAPDQAGTHCMVLDITTVLDDRAKEKIGGGLLQRAEVFAGSCGIDPKTKLGPLFTLIVEDEDKPMRFPSKDEFPKIEQTAPYLADLPEVEDPARNHAIHYEMVNQGNLAQTQFWINQTKYDPSCMNETFTLDVTEQWTLWNNSGGISHPFHIHQNPFQLVSQSDRGTYTYPVWRDTIALPKAKGAPLPNSKPLSKLSPWGNAVIRYVAKEFTGGFVNHCHILGHEDRGMMHNTQASCANGKWATTKPVPPGAECDEQGFCPGDCALGEAIPAGTPCPAPPPQRSDWPRAYGFPPKPSKLGKAGKP